MSNFTLTIIGAGVIGTSLGLALKRDKDAPYLIVHDKTLETAKAAVKQGAFDKAEWNLINACEQADMIILAIPLSGIRPTLEAIAPYLKAGAVVSDTARSKAPVLAWAVELLPPHVHFVGGNPLVYATGSGGEHASADLFQGRLYSLTPAPTADSAAVEQVTAMVSWLGASPFFLDAAEHDGLVTAVDLLPSIAGLALWQTVAGQPSWRETRKLAGSLFEQTTAGTANEPESLQESLLAHRDNLLPWLDIYLDQLRQLRTMLVNSAGSPDALSQLLSQTVTARHTWQADYQQGRFDDPELASPPIERPGLMRHLIGFGGKKK